MCSFQCALYQSTTAVNDSCMLIPIRTFDSYLDHSSSSCTTSMQAFIQAFFQIRVHFECALNIHVFLSTSLTGQDGDILLDYSKNIITEKTMQLLFKLVSITCSTCTVHVHACCRRWGGCSVFRSDRVMTN